MLQLRIPSDDAVRGDKSDIGRQGPLKRRNSEEAALLHELVEAVTALGNYLAVVQRELDDPLVPKSERLVEALAKSLGQHERTSRAIRRLSDLLRREADDQSGVP
jgi:hypothetical protein